MDGTRQIGRRARRQRMKKAMPTVRAIREWMTAHAAEYVYADARRQVDATALFEAWLASVGEHDRPPHDEDHLAWWIAVEVAVAWEDALS